MNNSRGDYQVGNYMAMMAIAWIYSYARFIQTKSARRRSMQADVDIAPRGYAKPCQKFASLPK